MKQSGEINESTLARIFVASEYLHWQNALNAEKAIRDFFLCLMQGY